MEEHRSNDAPTGVGAQPSQDQSPDVFVSPLIREAHEFYERQLPQLLQERPGQWVAYHGAERIGFAATKQEMYQVCRDRGFDLDETLVECIEPLMGDIIFGPGAIGDIFFGPTLNPPEAFVSPLLWEAKEVYLRELPQLLEERRGQWVAYHGAERVGFAPTKEQVYHDCLERGLKVSDLLVRCIEPPMGDIIFGPGAIGDLFSTGG